MLSKFFSWLYRDLIIREKEFRIQPDEEVLLRRTATLETKLFLKDGILILTSKRIAYRSLDTGLLPSWIGGKRTTLDISLGDIVRVTTGRKRVGPTDPLPQTFLAITVNEHEGPYTFMTVSPEAWQQRIDEVKSTENGTTTA